MTHNSPVLARRRDGRGFLTGTLIGVTRRHGHRVYRVRTVAGNVLEVSASQYLINVR